MKQTKWFDRKFEFSNTDNIFPSIIERLRGTPLRLAHKLRKIPEPITEIKPDNKWSIKEQIGHLIDLESLWQGRLQDILNGEEFLRPTDLNNTQTDLANHNAKSLKLLLKKFKTIRQKTIVQLEQLKEEDIFKYALHPRLKTPMRSMDLFLFVAEHDDHHLATIHSILEK